MTYTEFLIQVELVVRWEGRIGDEPPFENLMVSSNLEKLETSLLPVESMSFTSLGTAVGTIQIQLQE